MTEYDYSPAAYERYLAQQTRVSNWVSDTLQQSHAYSNPFVLSPTLRDRSFYSQPDDDGYGPRHHDQWSSSSRPPRSRSRSYVDHAVYDRALPSRHRTQSQSRSSSTPRDVYSHYHSYSQPHVASRARAPRTETSPPRNYPYAPAGPNHSPTRQTYMSQPPPGQIYHVSPNAPAPVPKDTLYRHASHSRHSAKPPPQPYLLVRGGGPKAEYKRGPPIHAPIPTKPHAAQQPLLKRLFGFAANSPVGGRSGNGRGFRGSSY